MTTILLNTLIGISIVLVIVFIFVGVKLYFVLCDVKDATNVVHKRVVELDGYYRHMKESINDISETIKAVMVGVGAMKGIKNKFDDFVSDEKKETQK